MPKITDKQIKRIKFAEQGDKFGILVLDELDKLEAEFKKKINDIKEEVKGNIEKTKDAFENIKLKKGDKGDKGDSIKGNKGDKGKEGKSIKGKQGNKGDKGDTPTIDEPRIALKASKIAHTTLLPHIPTIEQIGEKLPQMGEEIRNALELLQGEERLDFSAIKGLRKILNKLKKRPITFKGGAGSSGGRTIVAYDLSSQLDGVTKTFNLPSLWRVISVHSSSFPFVFRPTIDYTISGNTITFTSEIDANTTLENGQTITIIYAN